MSEKSPDSTEHEDRGANRALGAIVSGRVQGVGFRDFVRRRACSLGLTGLVRNLPGGEVEVEAEGDPEDLQTLVSALRRGPPGSRVDGVEVHWSVAKGTHDAFEIGF